MKDTNININYDRPEILQSGRALYNYLRNRLGEQAEPRMVANWNPDTWSGQFILLGTDRIYRIRITEEEL